MEYIDIFRNAVSEERQRQLEKWGEQFHDDLKWLAILLEEVGEVAKAILENDGEQSIEELVQVVAVIETWIESLEGKESK